MKKTLLALAAAASLAGCSSLDAQGVLTLTWNKPATVTNAVLTPGKKD